MTDGKGSIRVNGVPLKLLQPEMLRLKVFEPILLLGKEVFAKVDMRVRVRGGGYVSQIYAIRQAIAKGIVAWNQKCTTSPLCPAPPLSFSAMHMPLVTRLLHRCR